MTELTLIPLVRSYVDHRRKVDQLDRRTLSQIDTALRDFAASFGRRPLDKLGPRAIDRWIGNHDNWAPVTRRVRISQVRNFAQWTAAERITNRDWSIGCVKIRKVRTVPRFMTEEVFRDVLEECTDTRKRAIVWLLYGLGLRCVEVSRLRMLDWDRSAETILVTGKGSHERILPVPAPVRRALTSYLAECPATGAQPIIRKRYNNDPLSANTVSSMVRRMIAQTGHKTGAYDGLTAHGMRAAAATAVLEATHDIRVAQELLGHSTPAVTGVYLRRAGLPSLRAALDARTDMGQAS